MVPSKPGNSESEKTITRRQLLASLGAAGVILAAGGGFPGPAEAASTVPAKTDTGGLWFNVKDYGAGNSRSDDDSPFIQAAINAASISGGTVYLPPGKYMIGSSLTMRSEVYLLGAGPGATIIQAAEHDLHMVISGGGVTQYAIEGITFQGVGGGSGSLVPLVERGIYAVEAKDVRINNCVFQSITNGIHLVRSQHVSITDCLFSFIVGTEGPYEGFGIVVEGGNNHLIRSNHFKNVYKNGIVLNAGSTYCSITNNVMEGFGKEAILLSSKLTSCAHHLIAGNTVTAANLADTESSSTFGIRLKDNCSYNTLVNNVISRSSSAGIQLDAEEKSGDDRPYANTVTANTVDSSPKGIVVLNGNANSVKTNEVRRAEVGVLVDTVGDSGDSYAKQNIVTGNSLFQCSTAAVKIGSAGCQSSVVFGNSGFDNGTGLADSGTDTATAGF